MSKAALGHLCGQIHDAILGPRDDCSSDCEPSEYGAPFFFGARPSRAFKLGVQNPSDPIIAAVAYPEGGKPSREDFAPIALLPRAALGAEVIALHGVHHSEGYLIRDRRRRSPAAVLVEIDIAARLIDPALVGGSWLIEQQAPDL